MGFRDGQWGPEFNGTPWTERLTPMDDTLAQGSMNDAGMWVGEELPFPTRPSQNENFWTYPDQMQP
jgi:hypothetical protein